MTKKCTLCLEEKPLLAFSKATREKDGHRSRCKLCTALGKKPSTPESREKARIHAAKRRADDPQSSRESAKRYREKNPEKVARYVKENVAQARAAERARYHKARDIRCDDHVKDWAKLRRESGYYHFDIQETRAVRNEAYRIAVKSKCEAHVQCWAEFNKTTPEMRAARRRELARKIYEKESAKYCAKSAYRRAKKITATPAWSSKEKIEEFYFAADFLSMITGEWHHVDHVVPLISDIVCGLHVEQNLQVLTAKENLAKSNSFVV